MSLAFGEDVSDEQYGAVANAILAEFDSLYDGFEGAAIHGAAALEDTDLDEEEVDAIVDVARENVSVPYVNVTGYVDLRCPTGDGVDRIKEALQAAGGNGEVPEGVELEVTYVGSPEYRIKVRAPDYKTAESELEAAAGRAREVIEGYDGTATYHRERHEDDE
jgi:translation initiation factor 2 subunit 1